MTRLHIHVEGQTEETFVREVLSPHLHNHGYTKVSARLLGNPRPRNSRGGIRPWNMVKRDILNHLKEDQGCLVTTMVDYYGLPSTGDSAWPGRQEASSLPFSQKAATVESALLKDISSNLDDHFPSGRFLPYVVMHEFEGLLFSDCRCFGDGIGRSDLIPQFQAIRDQFQTPEEIDDSPITAPSKRIETLIPNYQKPLLGILAILTISLQVIREECPNFQKWLEKLESWPENLR